MNGIIIIGAGGHARSVVDAIEQAGTFQIKGFVDADPHARIGSYDCIGTDSDLAAIRESGVENAAICIGFLGNSDKRQLLFDAVKLAGFSLPPIVDPTAAIARDAEIGEGVFIGKAAVVNASATVGAMAIINSGAVVEHDCIVGDFSHVAINASLCGGCLVGESTLIGAGAVVLQGIKIGSNSIVGAGSIVLADVEGESKIVGVYNG